MRSLLARVERLEKRIKPSKNLVVMVLPPEFHPKRAAQGFVASYWKDGKTIWLTQKELDNFEGMIITLEFIGT